MRFKLTVSTSGGITLNFLYINLFLMGFLMYVNESKGKGRKRMNSQKL